jgi:hypothetical protein
MEINKSEQPSQPNQLRRKLFRGVPAGVGVLLAVQAKTALGTGVCASPSAIFSGNTSPRPGDGSTCSGGLSPGYWKQPQKFGSWSIAGAVEPTFTTTVNICSSGVSNLSLAVIATSGTRLDAIGFGTGGAAAGTGIWAILAFPGTFSGGQLLRHLAAAWLNAGYFKTAAQKYPLSQQQVIDMWNATKSGGTYCPGNVACTTGWTAAQVIAYVSGMYDINASGGDPDLCKP